MLIIESNTIADSFQTFFPLSIISDYFGQESKELNKYFRDSFPRIHTELGPYLYDPRVPSKIFNQTKEFLDIHPNYNENNPNQIKLYNLFKQFKEICFTKDIPLLFFGKRKDDTKFSGFTGLINFPAIQIAPSGDISILNSWSKLYFRVDRGLPSMSITGVDLGLRTPVAIGDITRIEGNPNKIHYSEEISKKILTDRDRIISHANIESKKNINNAFKLQKIAQKTEKRIKKLIGKPYLQSAIYKSSLTDKQNNTNSTVAHKLASSIIQYAKKTITLDFFKNIYPVDFLPDKVPKLDDFLPDKVPNFENSLLRINTELLNLSTKSGDPYATQKSQWLYGKINKYLEGSCQIQGICDFTFVPPAYTSKLSHLTQKEGEKGYLVKINTQMEITIKDSATEKIIKFLGSKDYILEQFQKEKWIDDGLFHSKQLESGLNKKKYLIRVYTKEEIIVKESPSGLKNMDDWITEGENMEKNYLGPLVRDSILKRFRREKWEGFEFIPLGSGNICKLNSSQIIDRDSNAAINIAMYNPYLYNAGIINLQIDRIDKNKNIPKSQKRIGALLIEFISKLKKVVSYVDVNNNFSYNYLNLFQVPEVQHGNIGETIYKGIIYHISKPRNDEWPNITNAMWRHGIEEGIFNKIWTHRKIRAKNKEEFINNIKDVFTNAGKIPDVISDFENMLPILKKIFDDEKTFGKVPKKSLIRLSSIDSAAVPSPEEFDIPEIDINTIIVNAKEYKIPQEVFKQQS